MDNPLDFNHREKPSDFSEAFQAAIDAAMEAENQSQERRSYLGGSRLGEECARMLQYEYRGTARKPFPGRILRIFERGHDSEARMIKRLRLAGFEMVTERKGGGQLGFKAAWSEEEQRYRIRGHYDGVIVGVPKGINIKVPCIWEHKCLGAKGWKKVRQNGVRVERPVYAGQISLYQAYEDLTANPALFTAENADTGELHGELVPFDAKLAQECSDRGVSVLQAEDAGELLPRPYADSSFYKCRFCDFAGECWDG